MTDGVLLLHAWPVDARMWEAEITALEPTVRVVAPHHPGFGGSRSAGAVLSMHAAASSALSALDAAGIDRAVVVGCSLGGYVAFELWRRAPERVLGLGLVNTRAVADPPEAVQGRHELAERLRTEGSAFLVEDPPPLLSEGAPREVAERVRGWITEQPAASIAAAALGMAERPDSTPDLPVIAVPSLVLTSTGDRLIPSSVSLAMAELLPDAESVVLDGAGHLPNLEAPEPFLHALRRLLRRSGSAVGTD